MGELSAAGFALLPRFLDRERVAALRELVDEAVRAPAVPGCERPHNRLVPLRWNAPAVGLVLGSDDCCRRIRAACNAGDLRWISGYVSVKEPRTRALWWHQDWWCWDHPVSRRAAAPQVALLVYLSDTDDASGALRLLPGSHRALVPLHAAVRAAHSSGQDIADDHPAMRDQPGQVTVRAAPGDAALIDYRLLHGTHPNRSDARRDCLLLSFTPHWCGLPGDVRAHLIQHLALPAPDEDPSAVPWAGALLPEFAGARVDLPLSLHRPV